MTKLTANQLQALNWLETGYEIVVTHGGLHMLLDPSNGRTLGIHPTTVKTLLKRGLIRPREQGIHSTIYILA